MTWLLLLQMSAVAQTGGGERLFAAQCAICHGQNGEGGRGPTLAQPVLPRAPDDAALTRVIRAGIAGTGMPGTRLNEAETQEIALHVRKLGQVAAAVLPGDVRRGEALYRGKGNCAQCHMIDRAGGTFGPDLSNIGLRRSPRHLRESLVDPSADVPRGFVWVRAVTNGGKTASGARVNEDTFSIQLRDSSGTHHSLWKTELRELRKELSKSPMPSYRGVFQEAELDDLVAFLAGLREAQ
ncbi:MAG: c-type cytochrome [Candidatus Solibacter usitatus]|nr:c-type cytochrome [Candidatus Solibacter usitatus]